MEHMCGALDVEKVENMMRRSSIVMLKKPKWEKSGKNENDIVSPKLKIW